MPSSTSMSAQPMTPRPILRLLLVIVADLGQRVAVHVDDVVEEVDGRPGDPAQPLPVDGAVLHHDGQVDRAEVAALVGQERLLATRVCGLDLAQLGRGVVAVQPVEEDDARLAVLPGQVDDEVEDLAGVQPAHLGAVARVAQRVVAAGEHRRHELLGDPHRDVEVVEDVLVFLGPDELQDVGMVDAQDAHVGAPPGAALLDGLGGHVEHPHERDRAAGHAHGGSHQVVLGPQAAEAEARCRRPTGAPGPRRGWRRRWTPCCRRPAARSRPRAAAARARRS